MSEVRNFGVNIELEKAQQDGTEFKFGALSTPCLASFPAHLRAQYLPKGELQNIGEEKMGCVSRGYINILETKFNWLLKNKKLKPVNEKWLRENGYIENGKVVLSDAYIEILSGTTRQGNSMKAPASAIHAWGLIPKSKLPQLNTFDEHMNPARVTPELKILGKEFIARFPIEYDQVNKVHFSAVLDEDSLNAVGYAWPAPVNGEYPRVELPYTHAFMVFFKPLYYIFDNYIDSVDGDFIKKLAPDYDLYEYAYRIYIVKENIVSTNLETTDQAVSWITWLFSLLKIPYGKTN